MASSVSAGEMRTSALRRAAMKLVRVRSIPCRPSLASALDLHGLAGEGSDLCIHVLDVFLELEDDVQGFAHEFGV